MLDWSAVLLKAGLNTPVGVEQFTIRCPFHTDQHDSCSINTETGLWICFRGCGQGSLKSFLRRYLNLSGAQVDKFIGDHEVLIDTSFFDDVKLEPPTLPEVQFPYNTSFVPDWVFNRQFTVKTLRRWECGITGQDGLAFPIRDELARTVGWAVRRKRGFPKYLYNQSLKKSKLLFGGHLINEAPLIYVTEGPLDAMWLDQYGYPAVAILGASMSKAQASLLQDFSVGEVVLCFDNDEAGQIGLDKALTVLGDGVRVSYVKIPEPYKDVQDIREYATLDRVLKDRNYW
jgi:DNA primase|tara:strand:- start:2124 stop:2984 length:861 start_codon:yes stop_codon:yes gene_type:complete